MSKRPRLFKVDQVQKTANDMEEVEFSVVGFQERRDIQEWIAANPSILGQDLLVVAKEFSGFDQTRERLDLLAVASDGRLIVIELKRDDTGVDAHWLAIKYASYFHSVTPNEIVEMLARYEGKTIEDAQQTLVEHTDSDEKLDRVNEVQRIILTSHRFAPEVTSAALWLNEQAQRDLVTCVQLTPYKDSDSGEFYLLANTIILVPGAESYFIGLGRRAEDSGQSGRNANSNKEDEVTQFCREIEDRVNQMLPDSLRPNRSSKWAGGDDNWRYYYMWYSGPRRKKLPPWGNWDMSYRLEVTPTEDSKGNNLWEVSVGFGHKSISEELHTALRVLNIVESTEVNDNYIWVCRSGEALDGSFCQELSQTLCTFIEAVTPKVREFVDHDDEAEI